MNIEIRPVEGFDGYFVTNDGRVIGKRKELTLLDRGNGYLFVNLYNKGERKKFLVHRLVAQAFIPNPNEYPIVNHKDENPQNNNVDNLEWCTVAYNNAYGTRGKRTSIAQMNRADCSKAVIQYTMNGEYVGEYPSAKEAWRKTGINRGHICDCCNHYRNQYSASGYRWAWKSEVEKYGNPYRQCKFGK